jgi:very-short-patch-repair endonuclease
VEPGTFSDPVKAGFLTSVQIADALMRRKRPILEAERFGSELAALPSRHGVRAVRDVFTHARPHTDSLPETQLRLLLADAGVEGLAVNYRVTLEGRDRYLDLALVSLRIAIEYHGRQHTNERAQVEDDIRRRAALHAAGWITIDVLWEDMARPARLIARVRRLIATAQARA